MYEEGRASLYDVRKIGSFVTFLFAFVLPDTEVQGGANGPHFQEGLKPSRCFRLT